MGELNLLPYEVDEVPVKKNFQIQGTEYSYEVRYNDLYDYYTMLVRDDENNILYTTKLVSANDALHAAKTLLGYEEDSKIIPISETADPSQRYGQDNFGVEVNLYEYIPSV